jgi:hypothetical protein
VAFPHEWWVAAEVAYAIRSFGDGDYTDALKAWRKGLIGRGNPLRAKDFDNALKGAHTSMAGKPETVESTVARTLWYVRVGMPPCFARPSGWAYSERELDAIAISRAHELEPVFLAYTETAIEPVDGPTTKINPWDKWRKV